MCRNSNFPDLAVQTLKKKDTVATQMNSAHRKTMFAPLKSKHKSQVGAFGLKGLVCWFKTLVPNPFPTSEHVFISMKKN